MSLEKPTKSFIFGELVFDTGKHQSPHQSSQLQPSIAVDDDALSRDHERLSKRSSTLFSECGQLGGRDGETKTNIARVLAEFAQTIGYGQAGIVATLPFKFGKHKQR
jgi:hypothetical protein